MQTKKQHAECVPLRFVEHVEKFAAAKENQRGDIV